MSVQRRGAGSSAPALRPLLHPHGQGVETELRLRQQLVRRIRAKVCNGADILNVTTFQKVGKNFCVKKWTLTKERGTYFAETVPLLHPSAEDA